MVRQYEETRRSHFVARPVAQPVRLPRIPTSSSSPSRPPDRWACARCATRVRSTCRCRAATLAAESGKRLLDALAALEPSRPREGGILELAGTIAANLPLASVVVLLCGSTRRGRHAPRRLRAPAVRRARSRDRREAGGGADAPPDRRRRRRDDRRARAAPARRCGRCSHERPRRCPAGAGSPTSRHPRCCWPCRSPGSGRPSAARATSSRHRAARHPRHAASRRWRAWRRWGVLDRRRAHAARLLPLRAGARRAADHDRRASSRRWTRGPSSPSASSRRGSSC